jgi:hypothetical protein
MGADAQILQLHCRPRILKVLQVRLLVLGR